MQRRPALAQSLLLVYLALVVASLAILVSGATADVPIHAVSDNYATLGPRLSSAATVSVASVHPMSPAHPSSSFSGGRVLNSTIFLVDDELAEPDESAGFEQLNPLAPCTAVDALYEVDPESECVFYCRTLLSYPLLGNMTLADAKARDEAALAAYLADVAVWKVNRTSCSSQVYGISMCNDCLARRRVYRCTEQFPLCVASSDLLPVPPPTVPADAYGVERPMCRHLCRSMGSVCKQSLNCTELPTKLCGAAARGALVGTLSVLLTLTAAVFLAGG